eukprot:9145777-Ditylum_brightwellii.AAC.1
MLLLESIASLATRYSDISGRHFWKTFLEDIVEFLRQWSAAGLFFRPSWGIESKVSLRFNRRGD